MIAKGVTCRLLANIPCTNPGACFSISGPTASGVTSLTANPVPPDVMIRLIPLSQDLMIASWIAGMESGIIFVVEISQFEEPRSVNTFERAGMHLSVEGSLDAVSEIMRIAAVSLDCGDDIFVDSDVLRND